jgi:cytochrome c biogenesis protein CcmG/thiol:disulfide interchange protein DsbE
VVLAGTVAATLIGFAVARAPVDDGDPLVSYDERTAPAFDLPRLARPEQRVSLAGSHRPAVLNIWASWCVPCRREMPVLQAAHETYGDEVHFIGVNHQDQRTPALEFLRETGVSYRSGFDPDGSTARAYGAYGLPTTYFITDAGRIIATKTGELTEAELAAEIERLLGRGAP